MRAFSRSRRRALASLAGIGGAALAGCCCLPASRCQGTTLMPGSLALPAPMPNRFSITIDAHCHIFNARDIPGQGFLEGPVVNDGAEWGLPTELLKAFAALFAFVLEAVTPSACDELEWLAARPSLRATDVEKAAATQRKRFSWNFAGAARDVPGFEELFNKQFKVWKGLRDRFVRTDRVTFFEGKSPLRDKDVAEILERGMQAGKTDIDDEWLAISEGVGQAKLAREGNPWDLVKFIYHATSPRHLNLSDLIGTYRGVIGPSIDLYLVSMLDFDAWLGPNPRNITDQRDGIHLMEQLAIASGGAFLPLVAFDPRADVDDDHDALARVQDAVMKRGFAGVKLYPPMGFLPYGNATATGPCHPADGNKLDASLAHLYTWAQEQEVPILAHAAHAIGKTPDAESCAGPDGWMAALGIGEVAQLKVQAGHLGGDNPAAIDAKWPGRFAELMDTTDGANLYADLADMSVLFGSDLGLRALFAKVLMRKLKNGGAVFDRVMYGSDFYMTDMHGATRIFAEQMLAFFEWVQQTCHGPADLTARVFGLNAVRFYGLSRSSKNRERIETFYSQRNVPKPAWMSKVDAIGG